MWGCVKTHGCCVWTHMQDPWNIHFGTVWLMGATCAALPYAIFTRPRTATQSGFACACKYGSALCATRGSWKRHNCSAWCHNWPGMWGPLCCYPCMMHVYTTYTTHGTPPCYKVTWHSTWICKALLSVSMSLSRQHTDFLNVFIFPDAGICYARHCFGPYRAKHIYQYFVHKVQSCNMTLALCYTARLL